MFRIISIHHRPLTRLISKYNAVVRQTYDIYVSCMWDPTLQNYPYNIIVLVSDTKVWLSSC